MRLDAANGGVLLANSPGVKLNASVYTRDYIAAQNKVVYTKSGSDFAKKLQEVHFAYCKSHKNDHENTVTFREKDSANSIYSRDFLVALHEFKLVTKIVRGTDDKQRTYYPVNVNIKTDAYDITRLMISAGHYSWKKKTVDRLRGKKNPTIVFYEKFGGGKLCIKIKEANCDLASFETTLRKYTQRLKLYGNLEEQAHNKLLSISNKELEYDFMKKYFIKLAEKIESDIGLFTLEKRQELMRVVINLMPKTDKSNGLTEKLFGCSRQDLYDEPFKIIWQEKIKLRKESMKTMPDWVKNLEEHNNSYSDQDNRDRRCSCRIS